MIIRTTDTHKAYKPTLKFWTGGWNAGYGPDCLEDLSEGDTTLSNRDQFGNIYLTAAEYAEFSAWWTAECDNANHGIDGDGLLGLDDEQIEAGNGWSFDPAEDAWETAQYSAEIEDGAAWLL